jgi:predicted TIM-barrel fold metal-dependent hydrolase
VPGLPERPVVDCHVHMRGAGSFESLVGMLRSGGLAAMNIACLPSRGGANLGQNAAALLLKLTHPGRFYAFGGLRYGAEIAETEEPAEQAQRLLAAGCDGIKMLEGKPTRRKALGIPLDDEFYHGFYEVLQSTHTPVLFHVGDPADFWDRDNPSREKLERLGWYYGDGSFPSLEQIRAEAENVLERHPALRVVFAHFYFLSDDLPRAEALLAGHPNVGIDLTPGTEMYVNFMRDPEAWAPFLASHCERVLFGTDNSGGREGPDAKRIAEAAHKVRWMRTFLETARGTDTLWGVTVRGIGLGDRAADLVCAGNFRRLAGETPRPVVAALAVEECERAVRQAETQGEPDDVVGELRELWSKLASFA